MIVRIFAAIIVNSIHFKQKKDNCQHKNRLINRQIKKRFGSTSVHNMRLKQCTRFSVSGKVSQINRTHHDAKPQNDVSDLFYLVIRLFQRFTEALKSSEPLQIGLTWKPARWLLQQQRSCRPWGCCLRRSDPSSHCKKQLQKRIKLQSLFSDTSSIDFVNSILADRSAKVNLQIFFSFAIIKSNHS